METDAERGLSRSEAGARLSQYGPNQIAAEKPPSLWAVALQQLRDPMNIMLDGRIIRSATLEVQEAALIGHTGEQLVEAVGPLLRVVELEVHVAVGEVRGQQVQIVEVGRLHRVLDRTLAASAANPPPNRRAAAAAGPRAEPAAGCDDSSDSHAAAER